MSKILDYGDKAKMKETRIGKALTYGIDISNHGNCDEMRSKIDFYDLKLFSEKAVRAQTSLADGNNDMVQSFDGNIVNLVNTDPSPIRIKKNKMGFERQKTIVDSPTTMST